MMMVYIDEAWFLVSHEASRRDIIMGTLAEKKNLARDLILHEPKHTQHTSILASKQARVSFVFLRAHFQLVCYYFYAILSVFIVLSDVFYRRMLCINRITY